MTAPYLTEIELRFTPREQNSNTEPYITDIRGRYHFLAARIATMLPDSYERDNVMRMLEEAYAMTERGLMRHEADLTPLPI